MRLTIVGLGYVGSATAACLAALNHDIVGVDIVPEKVRLVAAGCSPVAEPGLDDLLHQAVVQGRLQATMDLPSALVGADAALICVGTPSTCDGGVDISHLRQSVHDVAQFRRRTGQEIACIVRATLLPDQHRDMMALIRQVIGEQPIAYCVHPEFLRVGQALKDFMEPPMIIFGCSDTAAEAACDKLYPNPMAKTVFTDPAVAALTKYACNCFHAVKITFANEMGALAQGMGVDAREVMKLVCSDTKLNLSASYLRPGFAFGGSCLRKDLRGLLHYAHRAMKKVPMLTNILVSNNTQIETVVQEILHKEPKRVGILGLASNDNSDDARESPIVDLMGRLARKGIDMRIFDPNVSLPRMMGENKRWVLEKLPHIQNVMVINAADAVKGCDIVVLARHFSQLDYERLPWSSGQFVIDLHGSEFSKKIPVPVHGLFWPSDVRLDDQYCAATSVA